MIKGNVKNNISIDELFRATNGGYDIFKHYLGNVSKVMSRPWGKKEKHPSWGIFRGDIWFYKDQATAETGNAIHFVQKYFNLDFLQAKGKIEYDFGLGGEFVNASPVKITWQRPNIKKEYAEINITDMPFKPKHHEFWNIAEVTEEHCRKMNTYAVKSLAINRRRVNIGPDEIVFAYYSPEIVGYKIYFPERKAKFKNNIPTNHLWNFSTLGFCDHLIIQKSNKDMNVVSMITPCVTATQSENASIFTEEVVEQVNSITNSPWIWYGADYQGVESCKRITGTNRWNYINTPNHLLPDINDTYGFVKMHNLQKMGTGLRELERFMESKNLL